MPFGLPGGRLVVEWRHSQSDPFEGHLLAAEKGKSGESYILAGPAIPLGEMIDFWGHLTGKSAPLLRIPANFVKPFAPLVGTMSTTLPLPEMYSKDSVNVLGATYIARADKARPELGWTTRPLQTGMLETFAWIKETEAIEDFQVSESNLEKQVACRWKRDCMEHGSLRCSVNWRYCFASREYC